MRVFKFVAHMSARLTLIASAACRKVSDLGGYVTEAALGPSLFDMRTEVNPIEPGQAAVEISDTTNGYSTWRLALLGPAEEKEPRCMPARLPACANDRLLIILLPPREFDILTAPPNVRPERGLFVLRLLTRAAPLFRLKNSPNWPALNG